jgi:hypothetical protein
LCEMYHVLMMFVPFTDRGSASTYFLRPLLLFVGSTSL